MNDGTFDRLTSRLSRLVSRRATVGGLAALLAPSLGDARKKRRRKRKKPHKKGKVVFNAFGCVDVGQFCQTNDQCCSGICQGKKGKKTCQAHDQSTCLAGQSDGFCSGLVGEVGCVTNTADDGVCLTTTGNAPYCAISGGCFPCATDADCVPYCGAEAACIICPANCADAEGTMCAAPISGACAFS